MASKIIVIGGVFSAFEEVFSKVQKLLAKQNFSFAIVAGDLFGETSDPSNSGKLEALLQGKIIIPLPTYFTVGHYQLPDAVVEKLEKDDEVCPNLYFLGRRGVLTTSEGVKIVALGGNLGSSPASSESVDEKYLPEYTDSDCKLLSKADNADILLTYQWPKSVQHGSNVSVGGLDTVEGVRCLASLCSTLKPRYHISSYAPFFFEREPFFYLPTDDDSKPAHVTRFLNIAPFRASSKQKWLYAFNLSPGTSSSTLPPGATITPFLDSMPKRKTEDDQEMTFNPFSQRDDHRHHNKRARRSAPKPSECFFCLSNPDIATHLITSIGTDSYLTIAKGPLTTISTFPGLGFPGHILIIPLTHAATFSAMSDPENARFTYSEMQRYRLTLHSMLEKRGLGTVTWEVSRGSGVHIHWQLLPLPSNIIRRGLVEAAFKVEAENLNYSKFERQSEDTVLLDEGDHFRVWIRASNSDQEEQPASPAESILTLPLSGKFRFDLQFGRIVMAKLLALENRASWKDAAQSKTEEINDAEAFKAAFKSFDFSLDED
ncbi:hypothetical protein LOZ58_006068 [Ophidiomyces ophidiicola]|nr:hypothetical protein LOZ65_004960 [Ophidiomyces ophidiicola]KAI1956847.1 hypothetical protein LOZ58_006068 [Ophidiomyces ophidiicola]